MFTYHCYENDCFLDSFDHDCQPEVGDVITIDDANYEITDVNQDSTYDFQCDVALYEG